MEVLQIVLSQLTMVAAGGVLAFLILRSAVRRDRDMLLRFEDTPPE